MVFNAHQRHEGRRCLPNGPRDRNQLVFKHMGLAHCVATRQQRGLEEQDDLLQETRLGLIRGMDDWNPSRGFRPSSYLMSRANGQVLHYRRDRSRMVRINRRLQDLYVSGQRPQQERMQKGLSLLDDSSIAERLRVMLQRWLDTTAAEVSKKIMPIGNLDLKTTPCCPKTDA
jgi:RNA polymerase sigma-B factor